MSLALPNRKGFQNIVVNVFEIIISHTTIVMITCVPLKFPYQSTQTSLALPCSSAGLWTIQSTISDAQSPLQQTYKQNSKVQAAVGYAFVSILRWCVLSYGGVTLHT
jgi:hypothetical protein